MLDFKKVLLFVLSFCVIFVLLNIIVPYTGLDKWYHQQFVKINRYLYSDYKGTADVRFETKKIKTNKYNLPFKTFNDVVSVKILSKKQIKDATQKALNARPKQTQINVNHAEFDVDTWQYGWIPLMLLMSLILATPVPIPRRLFALFLGMLAITGYTLFRFWVRFVVDINRHGWLELGTQGAFMKKTFVYMNTFLLYMGMSLIVTVFIWLIVTIRRGDHLRFLKASDDLQVTKGDG